jgi:hypothetical protein
MKPLATAAASYPLYRARRLLTMAAERLPDNRRERLVGLLAAGDPKGAGVDRRSPASPAPR